METWQIRVAPLERLEGLLPRLLQDLSLARSQIAIDQLRSVVNAGGRDRILLITASDAEPTPTDEAALVAIQHPDGGHDTATVVHAGFTRPAEDSEHVRCADALRPVLEEQLEKREIDFLQWATDPRPQECPTFQWCSELGFESVGTLDYLRCDVPADLPPEESAGHETRTECEFLAVDLDDQADYESFAALVDQTYRETLDCPRLTKHRTALQTLRGYRAASAFDPDGWFRIEGQRFEPPGANRDVGCLIIGVHPSSDPAVDRSSVLELVYMGIVPGARGRQYGKRILKQTFQLARSRNADRIILAVDRDNHPARRLYEAVGMRKMLSETVWVKSLGG